MILGCEAYFGLSRIIPGIDSDLYNMDPDTYLKLTCFVYAFSGAFGFVSGLLSDDMTRLVFKPQKALARKFDKREIGYTENGNNHS